MRRYFGYGSNLNAADFAAFLEREGFPQELGASMAPVANAQLRDRLPRFTRRSIGRGGGVLDVVPHPGGVTPGVVFELLDEELWTALDIKEGVSDGHYRPLDATVVTSDGRVLAVRTYEVRNGREDFVAPSAEYLRIVLEGYAAHGLDPAVIHAAAANRYF